MLTVDANGRLALVSIEVVASGSSLAKSENNCEEKKENLCEKKSENFENRSHSLRKGVKLWCELCKSNVKSNINSIKIPSRDLESRTEEKEEKSFPPSLGSVCARRPFLLLAPYISCSEGEKNR